MVKWMIESVIREAHKAGAKVGLCGDGRRRSSGICRVSHSLWIDSFSVSPDSFIKVKGHVAHTENQTIAANFMTSIVPRWSD